MWLISKDNKLFDMLYVMTRWCILYTYKGKEAHILFLFNDFCRTYCATNWLVSGYLRLMVKGRHTWSNIGFKQTALCNGSWNRTFSSQRVSSLPLLSWAWDRAWHQGEAVLRSAGLREWDGHGRLLLLPGEELRAARRTGHHHWQRAFPLPRDPLPAFLHWCVSHWLHWLTLASSCVVETIWSPLKGFNKVASYLILEYVGGRCHLVAYLGHFAHFLSVFW